MEGGEGGGGDVDPALYVSGGSVLGGGAGGGAGPGRHHGEAAQHRIEDVARGRPPAPPPLTRSSQAPTSASRCSTIRARTARAPSAVAAPACCSPWPRCPRPAATPQGRSRAGARCRREARGRPTPRWPTGAGAAPPASLASRCDRPTPTAADRGRRPAPTGPSPGGSADPGRPRRATGRSAAGPRRPRRTPSATRGGHRCRWRRCRRLPRRVRRRRRPVQLGGRPATVAGRRHSTQPVVSGWAARSRTEDSAPVATP